MAIARTHGMGWIPDVPDQRDRLFTTYRTKLRTPATLPRSIDLRTFCSPVEDQGDLGSCTAQALVGNLELLQGKHGRPRTDFSRLFVYYNERVREGTVGEDAGAMLRTGIKTLVADGVCHESLWPYAVAKFAAKPTARAYTTAKAHQVTGYYRLLGLVDMLGCLASGYPFVFGAAIYESFMTAAVASTGTVPMPKRTERMLGGHAMLAVGYDLKVRRFVVRNSWGTAWGLGGYCVLPFAYLESRNLSDDFWTIRAGEQV